MISRDLTERVAQAAFMADRRPQDLHVALDGVGDVARQLIELTGDEARPLRDAGHSLAAMLGSARAAHHRLNAPARTLAIAEMGRIAARVAAMEVLIPRLPASAARVLPRPPAASAQARPAGESVGVLETLKRLVQRPARPAGPVHLTLIQGGRS